MGGVGGVKIGLKLGDLKRCGCIKAGIDENRPRFARQVQGMFHLTLEIGFQHQFHGQAVIVNGLVQPLAQTLDKGGSQRVIAATGIADTEHQPAGTISHS